MMSKIQEETSTYEHSHEHQPHIEQRLPATGNRLEFRIEGMDCGDCARTIEKAVATLPGISAASVNFGAARLSVVRASGRQDGVETAIERKVSEAGYRATPLARRAS